MTHKLDFRHFMEGKPSRFNKVSGQIFPDSRHYESRMRRALVTKPAALGGLLRTTAILPAIKEQPPGIHIIWLALRSAADLLLGNPVHDDLKNVGNDPRWLLAASLHQSTP